MYRWQVGIRSDSTTLDAIWVLQIKTMRYNYTPIRMARIYNTDKKPNAGKDMKQLEFSFIGRGNAKWYSNFGR